MQHVNYRRNNDNNNNSHDNKGKQQTNKQTTTIKLVLSVSHNQLRQRRVNFIFRLQTSSVFKAHYISFPLAIAVHLTVARIETHVNKSFNAVVMLFQNKL